MAQRIGLKAVLDIREFNANVKTFTSSVEKMTKSVKSMTRDTQDGLKSSSWSLEGFGFSWRRVAEIVTGITIRDVFRDIKDAIADVSKEAFAAVTIFQQLRIRFEALAARDFVRQFGGTVPEALGKVTDQTKELLSWIRKMAVTTPFSVASLAQTIAYGQAFGFSVEQAKRMTIATGEFTAGMGLTNMHMERIIYNFGQMLASGRVLGRELRDLANNFVPIRDIITDLADKSGVSFNEMKKQMSEGKVTAEQFVASFVELAERDFPGAMHRMTRTVAGAKEKIQDFIQTVAGLELLSPVVDKMSGQLSDAIDKAFNPETLKAAATIGQTLVNVYDILSASVGQRLGPAFSNLFSTLGLGIPSAVDLSTALLKLAIGMRFLINVASETMNKIAEFVKKIGKKFGTGIDDITRSAESWGANIIISLANGMAKAIGYVIAAITAVANVIASLLKAKSPPKILPDLEWWGRSAMQSWLDGWKLADFSIFNDIASTVTGFIRSLGITNIPEAELIPRILGTREAIAQAINMIRTTGDVTQIALDKIFNAAGTTSKAIRDYIKVLFDFEKVTIQVTEANKILNFDLESTKPPANIFGQVIDSIEELSEASRRLTGVLGREVRSYVNSLFSVQDANNLVAKSQDELNRVTTKYDDLLGSLYDQQRKLMDDTENFTRLKAIDEAIATGLLTAEEEQRLELEKRGILLRRQIRDTEAEKKVAVDAAKDKVDAAKEAQKAAENAAERQRAIALQVAEAQLSAVEEQVDAYKSLIDIQTENNNLLAQQLALLARLAASKGAGKAKGAGEEDDGLDSYLEGLTEGVGDLLAIDEEEIQKIIDDIQKDLEERFNAFVENLKKPFRPLTAPLATLLTTMNQTVADFLSSEAFSAVTTTLQGFAENIGQALQNIKTFWDENKEGLFEIVEYFGERLSETFNVDAGGLLEALGGSILTGIAGIGETINTLTATLVEKGPEIQEALRGWVDWLYDVAWPKLKEIWAWITDTAVPQIKEFAVNLEKWSPTILAVAGAILALVIAGKAFGAFIGLVLGVGKVITKVEQVVRVFSRLRDIFLVVAPFAGSIGSALSSLIPVFAVIGVVVASVAAALATNFMRVRDVVMAWIPTIVETLGPAFVELKEAFGELSKSSKILFQALKPFFKFLGGVVLTILKVVGAAIILIVNLLIGVVVGAVLAIVRTVTYAIPIISKIIEGIAGFFNGIREIFLGIRDMLTGTGGEITEGAKRIHYGIRDVLIGLVTTVWNLFKLVFGGVISLVVEFVKGVIKFFVNLYKKLVGQSIITDMMRDIKDAFVRTLAQILISIGTWIFNTLKKFTDSVKDFIQRGKDIIGGVLAGIKEIFTGNEGILQKVTTWISDTAQKFADKVALFKEKGIEIITSTLLGIKETFFGSEGVFAKIVEWIIETAVKIVGRERLEEFLKSGKTLIENLIAGIKNMFEDPKGVYEKVKEYISEAASKVGETISEWVSQGGSIISGLISGISANAHRFITYVKNLILRAIGVAQDESKTDSPSKVFMDLSENWVLGLIRGIENKTSDLKKAMTRMVSEALTLSDGDISIPISTDVTRNVMLRGLTSGLVSPASQISIDKSIHVHVDANYKNVQSEAGIYYDISAALASISR